jgi:hypothetical protein
MMAPCRNGCIANILKILSASSSVLLDDPMAFTLKAETVRISEMSATQSTQKQDQHQTIVGI